METVPEGYIEHVRPMHEDERAQLQLWAARESRRIGVLAVILIVVALIPASSGEWPIAVLALAIGIGINFGWARRSWVRAAEMRRDASSGEIRETTLKEAHAPQEWNGVDVAQTAVAIPSETLLAVNHQPLPYRGAWPKPEKAISRSEP